MSDIIHLNEPSTADTKCGATSGYQVTNTMKATLMESECLGLEICDKCFPPSNKFVHTKMFIGGKANGKTHLNEKDETMEIHERYSNNTNNYKQSIIRVDATAMLGTIEVPIEYMGKYVGNIQELTFSEIIKIVKNHHGMPPETVLRINLIHFDKV